MTRVALLAELADLELRAAVDGLADHLRAGGLQVVGFPAAADAVLVYADRPLGELVEEALLDAPALLLAGPTLGAWPGAGRLHELLGLLPGRVTPTHEIRLQPGPDGAELTTRWPGDLLLTDRFPWLDKVADDVEVLVTAPVGLARCPVLTRRGPVAACTVGSLAGTVADPAYRRVIHRWLRTMLGHTDGPPVRVGLLGYGAVGVEHLRAARRVPGLRLAAVCDANPARVAAARAEAPEVTAYADPEPFLAADLDLVVVSTPPNTHAEWTLRALGAGRSVVVEKPFCLTTAEADRLLAAAATGGLGLAVYQNRRWDADYLTVKRVVRSGQLGEIFNYESFVGGYAHPCNYWHSDVEVSGGAVYDWGSHHLDWALDLLAQPVEFVTAHAQYRVWHDVTNADHTRVTLRFAGGAEAEFVHSDLAAAPKPKWYVLGTAGALVGSWREAAVLSRDAVGNLVEDRLQPAEVPAALSLHHPDGSVTALAVAAPPDAPFHRELADLLLTGAPMSVTAADARRNIAVMEAATRSLAAGGAPVRPA